jgi:hypothetical protein
MKPPHEAEQSDPQHPVTMIPYPDDNEAAPPLPPAEQSTKNESIISVPFPLPPSPTRTAPPFPSDSLT